MTTPQTIGAEFEKYVEAVLRQLARTYAVKHHRFVDSKAAGNFVSAQPADLIVFTHPGKATFVELKASNKHSTLQRSMLSPSQRGTVLHEGGVLGVPYLILLLDVKNDLVKGYNGLEAMKGRTTNHTKAEVFTCNRSALPQELILYLQLIMVSELD